MNEFFQKFIKYTPELVELEKLLYLEDFISYYFLLSD
jgi:hypothetical protein